MIIDVIFGIGIIISLVCAIAGFLDWGIGTGLGDFALGVMITVMVCFGAMLMIGSCEWGETRPVVKESYELTAMRDNTQLSGSACGLVFVVQAQVNEKLMYNYIYKDDLGIATESVRADRSYINITDQTPTVKVMGKEYVSPTLRKWLPLIQNWEYVFYLPEDSEVANDFVIDLE